MLLADVTLLGNRQGAVMHRIDRIIGRTPSDSGNHKDRQDYLRRAIVVAIGVAALSPGLGTRSRAFAQGNGGEKGEGTLSETQDRPKGKAGRIKVDVASDGSALIDVKCAEGEPAQACADVTRELIDQVRRTK